MGTEETRLQGVEAGSRRSGGPEADSTAKTWPQSLSTPDLQKLVRQLNLGVAALEDLPAAELARHDNLITAAAVARIELRQRLARERIRNAKIALGNSGWRR